MPVRRIIFWQPFASPHQEAFLEAVAEQFEGDVILGVERATLPPERVAQGWREPQHIRVRVIDISKPENHAALAAYRSSDSLHVFTGFFSHPLVWAGFHKLADSQAKLAIYSEAPEQPPLTGWLKRARGRLLAARWTKRFDFVLAVGGVGCEFFERIGFPKDKIVAFGYYLPLPPLADVRRVRRSGDLVHILSAGQLVRRKGVDLLIEACATLPKVGWRVDIYGSGPERQRLEWLAASLGVSNSIVFHGTATNPEVQEALAEADCVVVPSRFDGWGALVSESLGVGTPVICTAACGVASVIADNPSFHSRTCKPTVSGIRQAMQAAIRVSPVSAVVRRDIRANAERVLSPSLAATHFLALAS